MKLNYKVLNVANGYMLIPMRDDYTKDGYFIFEDIYVFNDFIKLTEKLAELLSVEPSAKHEPLNLLNTTRDFVKGRST